MPTIRKLPSGKFQAQVRLAGHKPKSKTFVTEEAALSWGELLEGQLKANLSSPDSYTVKTLGDMHLATLKPDTAKTYVSRLGALVNFFKELPIDCIERSHLLQYSTTRQELVKASTCRAELQLLSRVIKYARTQHFILNKHDPFKDFKYPDAGKPRERILTENEYNRILIDISPIMFPIVALAWETGMRRGEILSITKDMIDLDNRILTLTHTKNGHSRTVPLSRKAIQILTTQSKLCEHILFQVKRHSVTRAFKRTCERLNIEGVCFHTLRHSAITRIAKKGVNTHQLKAFSGHKDTRMLERYTHIQATDILHLVD